MSTLITDFRRLIVGQQYNVVSNAGYFAHKCTFDGFAGEFARFVDSLGRVHHVHQSDCYRDDNPVHVYAY